MFILRMLGVLCLVALALTIAGGVLGSPTSLSPSKSALTLREAAAGLFAAFFVIDFFANIGAWTYRWHLRSYRRKVRKIFNLVSDSFVTFSLSVALVGDYCGPSLPWRASCLFYSCNLVLFRFFW